MTYEELIGLARNGDPLIDPESPDSVSVTDEGLVILGSHGREVGETMCSDMKIRIEHNGFRAWFRDPAGATEEEVFHGPDWTAERFFEDYDDLVSWAYTW